MDLDLDSLSERELHELRARIDRAIATFAERRRREALAEVELLARERGFSLAELTGAADTARRRAAAPKQAPGVRFVNPTNPAETWSGKGRRPRWYIEAVAAGHDPEVMRA